MFGLVGRIGANHKCDSYVSGLILPNVKGCIQFADISFSYPTRSHAPVLRNVNLTINPGELVAVVSLKSKSMLDTINSVMKEIILRSYDPQTDLEVYLRLICHLLIVVGKKLLQILVLHLTGRPEWQWQKHSCEFTPTSL